MKKFYWSNFYQSLLTIMAVMIVVQFVLFFTGGNISPNGFKDFLPGLLQFLLTLVAATLVYWLVIKNKEDWKTQILSYTLGSAFGIVLAHIIATGILAFLFGGSSIIT